MLPCETGGSHSMLLMILVFWNVTLCWGHMVLDV